MINPHTGREFTKDFFKDYAKGKVCLIRVAPLIGVPCGDQATTVLCHYTMAGYKATGSRKHSLPDLCGAWGCNVCHDICDARVMNYHHEFDEHELERYHGEGVMRTLDWLVKAGLLPNP